VTRPAVDESWSVAAVLPLDDRQQAGGKLLAELDAPLVEGIDVPDRRLDEHAVLIKRDEAAERVGIELAVNLIGSRPIALLRP